MLLHFTTQKVSTSIKNFIPRLQMDRPYVIEKVLPSDEKVVRRIKGNKTQILHRIILRDYISDRSLDDSYQNQNFQRDEIIVIPQDNLYTIAWEFEFEPIFDNPLPQQDPFMIDSREKIENNTPTNTGNQKNDDSQNLNIDLVIDHPTSWDVGQSTVTKQNSDLTSENHVKSNEKLADLTEINNTDYTNDMPCSSKTGELHNDKNTRGGKNKLRPNPNSNYSDICRYWKHADYKLYSEINLAIAISQFKKFSTFNHENNQPHRLNFPLLKSTSLLPALSTSYW